MAKLILHTNADLQAIGDRRLQEDFMLTPKERFEKAYLLMKIAAQFRKGPLKEPQGLGIVLKRKNESA
jgi:hypothetical protein